MGVVASQNPACKVSNASARFQQLPAGPCSLRKKAAASSLLQKRSMTAVVIALAVIAWLIVLLLCLGLARSAALGDALISGRTHRRRRHDREAA